MECDQEMNEWDAINNLNKKTEEPITEKDWLNKYDFETILLYGKPKVGKTFAYMSLIDEEIKKNKDTQIFLLCTDNGASKTFKAYFKDRANTAQDNVKYFVVDDIDKLYSIIPKVKSEATAKDWIIIDLISDLWELSQEKFIEQSIKAFGGNISEYLINASKDTKKFGLFDGIKWQWIKKLDNMVTREFITNPFCNVFATATEKNVELETAFAESAMKKGKLTEKGELLSLYEKLGYKPAGSKDLSYKFSTIVYIGGIEKKYYKVVGDRGRFSVDTSKEFEENFWQKFLENERK